MKTSQQWIDPYFGSHSTYATFTQNELESLVLQIQKDAVKECRALAKLYMDHDLHPQDDDKVTETKRQWEVDKKNQKS